MTRPNAHEPVERFDRIWTGWADLVPREERIAQHRLGRERFLRALREALGRAPRPLVLEVGCGSAIDLALLAESAPGFTVIGLDISVPGLHAARAFATHLGVKVALCLGDTFALPFPSGSIGLVFSQGLLEHFRDPVPAIREQVRTLAPGGRLIISVPQRWAGYTLHKRRAIRRGTWPWGWEGEYTARELVALGHAEGLESLEIFGYQYWRAWGEPAWVLRDLSGKFHRRNPWREMWAFRELHRVYERIWGSLERRWGHLFMQNVVSVFQRSP